MLGACRGSTLRAQPLGAAPSRSERLHLGSPGTSWVDTARTAPYKRAMLPAAAYNFPCTLAHRAAE
eukprot:14709290-Alexandrium_andersonii.AAC.1